MRGEWVGVVFVMPYSISVEQSVDRRPLPLSNCDAFHRALYSVDSTPYVVGSVYGQYHLTLLRTPCLCLHPMG